MITQKYIGIKVVNATPMTRQAYNDFRGWQLPADENGEDEGYLVEYTDGGKANTVQYDGYVSWSPRDVFLKSYRHMENLSFSLALESLKRGKKVARAGWNGKNMHVVLIDNPVEIEYNDNDTKVELFTLEPFLILVSPNEVNTWVASVSDLLAEDWFIVN